MFAGKHFIIIRMTQKSETGRIGEDLACEYLKKQGYKILDRNFRQPWGEIDIVCQAPDKTLVFAEVKTMHQFSHGKLPDSQFSNSSLVPEDQMSKAKFFKSQKIAASYAAANKNLIDEDRGWRIDLLAISIKDGNKVNVNHYKNIEI